jgi:hypothetical protein
VEEVDAFITRGDTLKDEDDDDDVDDDDDDDVDDVDKEPAGSRGCF